MPFEYDSADLIEACVMALQSVEPTPGTVPAAARTGTERDGRQSDSRIPPQAAARQTAPLLPEEARLFEAWDLPAVPGTDIGAEALSRAVERDARRFEA